MKKYSPQKIIGKSNTNFFPDNKILLAIAAATILTFADTTDVIAGDDYPIGYGGTVDDVGTMASQVQSAATQYGIGSGMALQAVSWQEYYPPKHCNPYPSCAPFPTLDQMETMLNLALANSTPRLILWYSYFDTIDWDTKNNTTQYWNDVVTAANSIYSSSTDTITPTG